MPRTQLSFSAFFRGFNSTLIKPKCQNNRLQSTLLVGNLCTLSVSFSSSVSFCLPSPNSPWQFDLCRKNSQGHCCPKGTPRGSKLHHAERIVLRYHSFPAWGLFLLWELINWANLIRKPDRAGAKRAHTVKELIHRMLFLHRSENINSLRVCLGFTLQCAQSWGWWAKPKLTVYTRHVHR